MTTDIEQIKKKIIYRSNYRGTKEMDKLLGAFTNKYLNELDFSDLNELLKLLEVDDNNLYNFYNGLNTNIDFEDNKFNAFGFGVDIAGEADALTGFIRQNSGRQSCFVAVAMSKLLCDIPYFEKDITGDFPSEPCIFAACDSKYFMEHASPFINSASLAGKPVHIHVVNPTDENKARYSMPFFVHPAPEAVLNCIPSCVGKGAKYPPITSHAFLMERLKDINLVY